MKKAYLFVLALFLIATLQPGVQAETIIEEVEESTPHQAEEAERPQRPKKPKLSKEEMAQLKEKKKLQTQKMESCLVLTRSYYAQNEKAFQYYLDTHPAITNPAAKTSEKMNRNMLLSKINSQMLIQCESMISKEQVMELQKYKDRQDKFKTSQEAYQKIIAIDLSKFDVKEAGEEGHKVEFTQ